MFWTIILAQSICASWYVPVLNIGTYLMNDSGSVSVGSDAAGSPASTESVGHRRVHSVQQLGYVCVRRGRGVWAYRKPRRSSSLKRVYVVGPVCFRSLEAVSGPGCRRLFHKISEDAYVCGSRVRVTASKPRYFPGSYLPELPSRAILPYQYWKLEANTFILDKPGGRVVKRLLAGSIVSGYRAGRWLRTGYGIIAASSTTRLRPPTFSGVHAPRLPLAWVYTWNARYVSPDGRRLGSAPKYSVHRVLKTSGERILTPEGWLRLDDVRVARSLPRPGNVGSRDKWIAISYRDWTLVAYQGDRPVFATMIARGPNTPKGSFRIRIKYAISEMGLGSKGGWRFRVIGVPWTMKIIDKISLHAAFWHDDFGSHFSQGCINLSPRDARFLYHWTGPSVMPGWFEIRASENDMGTPVVIY